MDNKKTQEEIEREIEIAEENGYGSFRKQEIVDVDYLKESKLVIPILLEKYSKYDLKEGLIEDIIIAETKKAINSYNIKHNLNFTPYLLFKIDECVMKFIVNSARNGNEINQIYLEDICDRIKKFCIERIDCPISYVEKENLIDKSIEESIKNYKGENLFSLHITKKIMKNVGKKRRALK